MRSELLLAWLPSSRSSPSGTYAHQLLVEQSDSRGIILGDLTRFFQDAHEDTKEHLRKTFGISLHPLSRPDWSDGAAPFDYPNSLPLKTLKGYFGEIFAGLAAKYYKPYSTVWEIPAYLFRFHRQAFHFLQRKKGDPDYEAEEVVGRQGDDCLAFHRDTSGKIVSILVCEAKCTNEHDSQMVADAHSNLSSQLLLPVSIGEVIEVLSEKNDDSARDWIRALQLLHQSPAIRHNFAVYVCGKRPSRNPTWISTAAPHEKYQSKLKLEVIEAHIAQVDQLVQQIYGLSNSNANIGE